MLECLLSQIFVTLTTIMSSLLWQLHVPSTTLWFLHIKPSWSLFRSILKAWNYQSGRVEIGCCLRCATENPWANCCTLQLMTSCNYQIPYNRPSSCNYSLVIFHFKSSLIEYDCNLRQSWFPWGRVETYFNPVGIPWEWLIKPYNFKASISQSTNVSPPPT